MNCTACNAPLVNNAAFCAACGAAVPRLHPEFAAAEARYAELRARYEAGSLEGDSFKAAVEANPIDHDERYWMIGVESGAWYVHDGTAWNIAQPPLAAPATGAGKSSAGPASPPASAQAQAPSAPTPVVSLWPRLAIAGFALSAIAPALPFEKWKAPSFDTTENMWHDSADMASIILVTAVIGFVFLAISLLRRKDQLGTIAAIVSALAGLFLIALGIQVWIDVSEGSIPFDGGTAYFTRLYGFYVLLAGIALAAAGSVITAVGRILARSG